MCKKKLVWTEDQSGQWVPAVFDLVVFDPVVVAKKIQDMQRVCNEIARNLVNNMAPEEC